MTCDFSLVTILRISQFAIDPTPFLSLEKKIAVVFTGHDLKPRRCIVFQKRLRLFHVRLFPLELVCEERPVILLHQIDLLLIVGPPKITVPMPIHRPIVFPAFDQAEIFPQETGVVPDLEPVIVLDQTVADTQVVKVDLDRLGHLLPPVAGQGLQFEHDEALLKDIDIFLYGQPVDTKLTRQFAVRNLLPDLQCQQPKQVPDDLGLFQTVKIQNILEKIIRAYLIESFHGSRLRQAEHLGIAPETQQLFQIRLHERRAFRFLDFPQKERLQDERVRPTGHRLRNFLHQVEARRTGRDDLHFRIRVHHYFQDLADIRHILSLIQHDQSMLAQKSLYLDRFQLRQTPDDRHQFAIEIRLRITVFGKDFFG